MHAFQPTPPTRRPLRTSFHAVLLLSLGWIGCDLFQGGEDEKDTTAPTNVRVTGGVTAGETVTGQRKLEATADDNSGKVAKIEFYVADTLACADETAKSSGATFSCTWDSSKSAQGSYQLTAKAFDAAGNNTSSAPVSFTIPPPNHKPTITLVTATPTAVDEGSSTTLSVTASDSDGDPLTYSWTQIPAAPAGTFGSETGATRTWKAPILSRNTTFTLQVTVSDGKGGSAQAAVDVAVANVPALNRAPSVDSAITVSSTSVIAGDTVNLSIGATDPDGDPLTYSWTTEPAGEGTFTNETASAAQWRSSDISTAKSYTFKVTVSDGTDSVTRSVDVQVKVPTYANDIQPIWNTQCILCHNSSSGTRGGLNLDEGKSYASIVNVGAAGTGPASCGASGLKRVTPNEPDNSLIVLKLTDNPPCGGRMPQGNPGYFDEHPGELTRIRSWILAGALNN
ncbi:Ig-like domain-containing protein [Vitiosangium sp. GDMCC 1.1324]|uniref:PKD domain-containing protein n=1 Tax=Vitiosangium sp. (strain GDMCC 1.1324) TaxID=2138576 RepID=UPI000D36AB97|nr:Ig-like domain-containing protein [Vitiosangium sp. GDMCC 1.1324]PTL85763.1 PKD domain-containing protein [Vitiosangium sp. GDMCC 1.1324]